MDFLTKNKSNLIQFVQPVYLYTTHHHKGSIHGAKKGSSSDFYGNKSCVLKKTNYAE